jgi:hypothetical protein
MQQSCTYGSVRGASGNRRPYRDKPSQLANLATRRRGTPLFSKRTMAKVANLANQLRFSATC